MLSFKNRVVFLALVSCSASGLRNCGEFEKDEMIDEILREYSKPLPYQNVLDQLFQAYDEKDSNRMEEMYKHLEGTQTDESEEFDESLPIEYSEYAKKRIKFVPDLIKAHGYPAEDHKILTDDGYKLSLHRLPYGKKSPQTDKVRPPILIMHGLLEASNSWIALGPDNSLAYLLADAGYDVWLGNARGTEPSREHVRLRPNGLFQKAYWTFSWHEIGVFDLPAIIDYILDSTHHKQLNYIGFSQGTTSFFVMASMRPDYNDKIFYAHLMSPVACLEDQRNPFFNSLAHFYHPIKKSLELLRLHKFTISNKLASKVVEVACRKATQSTPFMCKLLLTVMDSNQINCTSLPDIFVNTPAGASTRQVWHYLQMIRNGDFSQFDYEDKKMNLRMYGRDTPPPYNLTQITAPIHIYYSKDDDTSTIENTKKLFHQLHNIKSTHLVPVAGFNHIDFTYSRFVRKAVYQKLVSNINKANGL